MMAFILNRPIRLDNTCRAYTLLNVVRYRSRPTTGRNLFPETYCSQYLKKITLRLVDLMPAFD